MTNTIVINRRRSGTLVRFDFSVDPLTCRLRDLWNIQLFALAIVRSNFPSFINFDPCRSNNGRIAMVSLIFRDETATCTHWNSHWLASFSRPRWHRDRNRSVGDPGKRGFSVVRVPFNDKPFLRPRVKGWAVQIRKPFFATKRLTIGHCNDANQRVNESFVHSGSLCMKRW